MIVPATEGAIAEAARVIAAGGLVAFPAETVYGLGAAAFNARALARVFAVKNRPRFDPLIVHVADADALGEVAVMDALPAPRRELARLLARAFWPGPLTLVLPRHPRLPGLVSSGLETVAVRVPAHEAALRLIRRSGAVAAPSANPFGALSPTRASHVEAYFKEAVGLILDGGPCEVGVESTVLDLTAAVPRVLRPGGVSREAIERAAGTAVEEGGSGGASPGRLKSHYAPRTPLKLHGEEAMGRLAFSPAAAYLFFSAALRDRFIAERGLPPAAGPSFFTLSEAGRLAEAAAALFETLRRADAAGRAVIHAGLAPGEGLGRAINDRLFKAAGSVME